MERDSESSDIQVLVSQGDQEMSEKSQDGVLVLGNSGSGKTTLLCFLAKKEMKGTESESGQLCIDLKDSNDPMRIGHENTSCTRNPNTWIDGITTYYDCSGFGDTESSDQEILNAECLKTISKSHKQLKFVLVISFGLDKYDRGNLVANLLIQLSSVITDTKSLFDGLSIVLTKCPKRYQVEYFINFLAMAIADNNRFQPVYELVEKLVKAPEKFCTFKMPSESDLSIDLTDKERILTCIKQAKFVKIQVEIAISEGAKLNVFENIENLKEKVTPIIVDFANKMEMRFKGGMSELDNEKSELSRAKEYLDKIVQLDAKKIEKFRRKFLKLSELMENTSSEEFKNLISKIQSYEEYSAYEFNICAWIVPFQSLNLKINEAIEFRIEQNRIIQIEEYKKNNAEAAEEIDRITQEIKDKVQNNENLIPELKRAEDDQDAKIEQLEKGKNKRVGPEKKINDVFLAVVENSQGYLEIPNEDLNEKAKKSSELASERATPSIFFQEKVYYMILSDTDNIYSSLENIIEFSFFESIFSSSEQCKIVLLGKHDNEESNRYNLLVNITLNLTDVSSNEKKSLSILVNCCPKSYTQQQFSRDLQKLFEKIQNQVALIGDLCSLPRHDMIIDLADRGKVCNSKAHDRFIQIACMLRIDENGRLYIEESSQRWTPYDKECISQFRCTTIGHSSNSVWKICLQDSQSDKLDEGKNNKQISGVNPEMNLENKKDRGCSGDFERWVKSNCQII